ncbi:phosphotransferase system HPr (HPr) family [Thalassobacillus cyri]|uniref:Phosphotransferase system HPr (HPr) family n=1 Tax=Thalassobacillus cyri TaxID=571932 RepID=A0A1H4DVM5_9BACI|nr:HPr family phosphocarrier protein [Thalassobacillus cyri]SEA76430.1 phosphotransferase system HPr (HPr) family [Thalassobacillus cyri]
MQELSKKVIVHIDETQTIMELNQIIQKYEAEILIKKNVNGSIIEVNLKSFLGLINLRLHNGDELYVYCSGPEASEAMKAIEQFLN